MKQIITKFGMDLMSHALNGGGIEFSEIIISNATSVDDSGWPIYDDDNTIVELGSPITGVDNGDNIFDPQQSGKYIRVNTKFDNTDLDQGFYVTLAVILARKKVSEDTVPEEAPYAVCLFDKETAEHIPSSASRRLTDIFMDFYIYVGSAENVTCVYTDDLSYVSKAEFENHTHTAAGVGAAEKTHKHSASDINSGVLSVVNGGTGVNSINDLRNKIMHFGTYIGNGESERLINLGVKPKFVFVWCFSDDTTGSFGIAMEDATGAVINQSVSGDVYTEPTSYSYHYTSVAIVDDGFKVSTCTGSSHSRTNVNGHKYGYMYY